MTDRIRMANSRRPRSDSNEIIDLTSDSPNVDYSQLSNSTNGHNQSPLSRLSNNYHWRAQVFGNPFISNSLSHHDPELLVERDDYHMQILGANNPPIMVHPPSNVERFRHINNNEPIVEYNAPVPCLNDTCLGEQIVISCPICFEPLSMHQKPMATPCGHVFCTSCLQKTLQGKKNKRCPKCNGPVKMRSCISLYF